MRSFSLGSGIAGLGLKARRHPEPGSREMAGVQVRELIEDLLN